MTVASLLFLILGMGIGCADDTNQAETKLGKSASEPVGLAIEPASSEHVLSLVREPGSKAVMVNVWATWCMPCREEFPDLVRVHRELKEEGFRLILVSGDFDSQIAEVEAFLSDQGVDFPTLIKAEDDMKFINTLSKDWTGALPATFLYDGSGSLEDFWEGKADYETLHRKVSAILEAANQPSLEEERT
jgi:thiol-disulfide isomerase/thioredoxin